MKRFLAIVTLLAGAFALGGAPGAAQSTNPATPASPDLLRRMSDVNAGLKTYKADIHLDVELKTFPFISPSLDGNVYFKQPDKQAVVFDTVPSLASQFKKVYPRIDAPSSWPSLYTITTLSDQGGTTAFRLVPKKEGRIEHLDVKVDDATATIKSYTWTYRDGGYVTFDQTYKSVDGNFLVDKQTGHVELPSYKADVTSAFTNYHLNVEIADSVFDDK